MYEFWYDYVKPKYREKAKLCYMDTDSFIIYRKMQKIHLLKIKLSDYLEANQLEVNQLEKEIKYLQKSKLAVYLHIMLLKAQ